MLGEQVSGAATEQHPYLTDETGVPEEEDTEVMFRVWLNERMAPTLLPFAEETVSNIMELIANQVPSLRILCNDQSE